MKNSIRLELSPLKAISAFDQFCNTNIMDHSEWDFVGNLCLDGNNCILEPAWRTFEAIECTDRQNIVTSLSNMGREQCMDQQRDSFCSDNKDSGCNYVSWKEGFHNNNIM